MSRRREETYYPRIEEVGNTLVQLFNILLEGVARDKKQLREDITSTYNTIISTLALYVDFTCLDPYTRYLLESNLMSDIILSHLEHLDEAEEGKEPNKNWLRLSGRTKALIAIAVARCGKPSKITLEKRVYGAESATRI